MEQIFILANRYRAINGAQFRQKVEIYFHD